MWAGFLQPVLLGEGSGANAVEDDLAHGLQMQMVAVRMMGVGMPGVELLRV